jgi:hypothetical protein
VRLSRIKPKARRSVQLAARRTGPSIRGLDKTQVEADMRIAIIGAGSVGQALALGWGKDHVGQYWELTL